MNNVQWELGYEEDVDPTYAAEFGLENRDDLDAINNYFGDLVRQVVPGATVDVGHGAKKISQSTYEKWLDLKKDWLLYYQKVTSSWYVSDEDVAFARLKRNDVNKLLTPLATEFVQKHAKEAKPALTPEEFREMQDEGKPWWEKHWKAIAAVSVGTVASVWLLAPRILVAGVKAFKH